MHISVRRALLALVPFAPLQVGAQFLTRPERDWKTITTAHFDIHYPSEMRAWAEPVARRMESVAAAVNALVGSAPKTRVTVLIEDPSNVANGFAVPLLEGPTVFFWPTPPSPGPTFGSHRGWGEMLAVHEYGHIAHLTVPSRNARENFLWHFLPSRIGPVARKSPAWVTEGYATYIEGKLTGNGRPNSVGRSSVLREWALEGQLPSYAQLNNAAPFLGGSMRYLVGSAFLEWLVAQRGEQSLPNLWRRMSARQSRGFGAAFQGVFGALPDELYGRFVVDVTTKALEVERQVKRAGLVEGEIVQHYRWGVGAPAVSPDGRYVALAVGSPGRPSRLVVIPTADVPDSDLVRARQRVLARDSLDVAPWDSFPASRKPVASLRAVAGRAHDAPRWFADGDRLLVTRDEPLGDGASRPDIFEWNFKRGKMRRITHGAGIRYADPSPDGKNAAAVQCLGGVCDLVLVELATGRIRRLAGGSPTDTWHRPRYAPDGRRIAASLHRNGAWRVALVDASTGEVRFLPGEDASRYAPVFAADGKSLVLVSEASGAANVEQVDLDGSNARSLTHVSGAAAAPDLDVRGGQLWFLTLHAKGYDLRRLSLGAQGAFARAPALRMEQFPAAPRAPFARDTFAQAAVDGPRAYGLGPRHWRLLPGVSAGVEGNLGILSLTNVDPISRLGVVFVGGYGDKGTWRGGSAAFEARKSALRLGGGVWYSENYPSRQHEKDFGPEGADSRYSGFGATAGLSRERGFWGASARAGVSTGVLDGQQLNNDIRSLYQGEVRLRLTITAGSATITPAGTFTMTQGKTDEEEWSRGVATGSLTVGTPRKWIRGEMLAGHVTHAGQAEFGRAYELFLVGGNAPPFADARFRGERVALPGVPVGFLRGERVGLGRVTVGGFGLPVEVSLTHVAAGRVRNDWKRLVGVERSFSVPSLGFARLPAVDARAGVAYSIDAPWEKKARAFVSLTYRP